MGGVKAKHRIRATVPRISRPGGPAALLRKIGDAGDKGYPRNFVLADFGPSRLVDPFLKGWLAGGLIEYRRVEAFRGKDVPPRRSTEGSRPGLVYFAVGGRGS
jgi:hypothetical protein